MKTLGLDISSTRTGYAVIIDGVLIHKGLITGIKPDCPNVVEDFVFIQRAQFMANEILKIITSVWPDNIVIEQTNLGNSRTDQKLLEFVHYAVLSRILEVGKRDITRYVDTSRWRSVLQIKLNAVQRAHNKNVKAKLSKGKVTPKHLAVEWANATYKLDLLKKDHDIADAIALATYGQQVQDQPAVMNTDSIDKLMTDKKIMV